MLDGKPLKAKYRSGHLSIDSRIIFKLTLDKQVVVWIELAEDTVRIRTSVIAVLRDE
jgi:hypothetical protein